MKQGGGKMLTDWKYEYLEHENLIKVIGDIKLWNTEVSYSNLFQTLSQCDMNHGGSPKTRRLARYLLTSKEVISVKLFEDTICILVEDETDLEKARIIAESAISKVAEIHSFDG